MTPRFWMVSNIRKVLKSRIQLFADLLNLDAQRIWGWSFAQTILSAGWLLTDDRVEWREWHALGKVLMEIGTPLPAFNKKMPKLFLK